MIGRPLRHLPADCSDEIPYSPILYAGQPTMEDGSVVRVNSFSPSKGINQSASSFNPEKLLLINQRHIIGTLVNKLGKGLTPFLSAG